MAKILLVASLTFKDCIRSKALYGVFFFGVLLFLLNIVVTGMFSWEPGKVAVDFGLSVVSLSGLLLIFFFSMNIANTDLEKRSVYLILSRPVSRPQYIMGKYLGLSFLIVLSSAVLGICAVVSFKLATLGSEGFIPQLFSWGTFAVGLGMLVVSLLVMVAVALLWVFVTTHPFTAVLLSIVSYFIGQNFERVANIISAGKIFSENIVLMKVIKAVSWVFPNLAAFDLKTTAAYGLGVNPSYVAWVTLYGASYIGICLLITILAFQRRELA